MRASRNQRSCVLALNEVAVHLRYRTSSAWTRELVNQQIEEGKTLGDLAAFNVKEALHSPVWMWMTSAQDSAVGAE